MAAVLAIGWKWFDRDPLAPWVDVAALQRMPRHRVTPWAGALLTVAVPLLFVAWSAAIAGRVERLPDQIELPAVPGWQRIPLSTRAAWTPYYPAADRFLYGRYGDDRGDAVDLSIAVFGSEHDGKKLITFGTGVLRQNDVWVRVEDLPPIAGGSAMRITAPGNVQRVVATWYRVGDVLTADPVMVKLETLKARLFGGPQRAVAIHVSAVVRPGMDSRAEIGRFLAALGPLDRVADASAGMIAPPPAVRPRTSAALPVGS
jgi:EpsI family protein